MRFVYALMLLLPVAHTFAAVETEHSWQDTFVVDSGAPYLTISNIWGGVTVRTGPSGEISVAAVEHRSAPDQARYDQSFAALRLDVDAAIDGVALRVGDNDARWHSVNECRGCRLDIQFEVTVPPGTTVDVATVMDGRVAVLGVSGSVSASNVNGPVEVDGIHECESIASVNGKVRVGFGSAPENNCTIETVNGDITLDVPDGTGLDIELDLFNGDLSSELDTYALDIPAIVTRTVEDGHSRYRIQKYSGLRIGAGGPVYSISSINGDVRIHKLK